MASTLCLKQIPCPLLSPLHSFLKILLTLLLLPSQRNAVPSCTLPPRKITTLLQWAAIGGYAIASTEKYSADQSMVKIGSDVLASTAAAIGAVVNIQYVTQAVYNP